MTMYQVLWSNSKQRCMTVVDAASKADAIQQVRREREDKFTWEAIELDDHYNPVGA